MGEFNTGAAAKGILARALTGNIFVEQNLAFMNEGDKDGYNVFKHDIQNTLSGRTDDPATSIVNTSKKKAYKRDLTILETKESFNPKDYHNFWLKWQPDGVFQWEGLPVEVQASLEELFLGTSAEATEDALTNGGDFGNGAIVTGLIPQLESNALTPLNGAKANPTQITENTAISFRAHGGGTGNELGVALTAANIFEKIEIVIAGQSKQMRKRPNRKFMISLKTADIMREAQRALSFKGVDIYEDGFLKYGGYTFITNPSFPDDTLLLASMGGGMKTDAIQLGTSMSADFNNLAVDRLSNFNRMWLMVLTYAIDIFLVRPEEVCYYTTNTIA